MTCSRILQAEGKPYPRTCPIHGLNGCPDPTTDQPIPRPLDLDEVRQAANVAENLAHLLQKTAEGTAWCVQQIVQLQQVHDGKPLLQTIERQQAQQAEITKALGMAGTLETQVENLFEAFKTLREDVEQLKQSAATFPPHKPDDLIA